MVEKPYCKDYPDDSIFNSCQDVWGLPQSTPPRNNVSTLNSASSYEKDVFFVYDDTCDHYNAQEIMNKIVENHRKVGKELRIENFAWRPPGYPLGRYFADSLDTCHYTCILVSKLFLKNIWYTFQTDMAIQNMLQNEHKRFTVIVIVVDLDMKLNDLPLDLQTLSPILKSERYFETRLAKAFEPPFYLRFSRNCPKSISSASTLPYQSSNIARPVQETGQGVVSSIPASSGSSCYNCVPGSFSRTNDFSSGPSNPSIRQDDPCDQLEQRALDKGEEIRRFDAYNNLVPSNSNPDISLKKPVLKENSSCSELEQRFHKTQISVVDRDSPVCSRLDTVNHTMINSSYDPTFKRHPNLPYTVNNNHVNNDDANLTSNQHDPGSCKIVQQTNQFFDFPSTTSRVPQEHSDSSAMTELLSSVSSLDYNRQASVVAPSNGLRNPVESDEVIADDVAKINDVKCFPLDFKKSYEVTLSGASNTLQEILPESFTQQSPSLQKKLAKDSNAGEPTDWEVVDDEPKNVLNGNETAEQTDSLNNVEVEISDEELSSDRSISSGIRSWYYKIKSKLK